MFFKFVFVCFESHQQNTKPKTYFLSKASFLLDNTYTASARSILGQYVDPYQEWIITLISAANQSWECAEQQKNINVENNTD